MKKTLVVFVLVVAGLYLWFYLLLGKDASKEKRGNDWKPEISTVEDKATTEKGRDTVATTSVDAPPQTDVGMEFPTLPGE